MLSHPQHCGQGIPSAVVIRRPKSTGAQDHIGVGAGGPQGSLDIGLAVANGRDPLNPQSKVRQTTTEERGVGVDGTAIEQLIADGDETGRGTGHS